MFGYVKPLRHTEKAQYCNTAKALGREGQEKYMRQRVESLEQYSGEECKQTKRMVCKEMWESYVRRNEINL